MFFIIACVQCFSLLEHMFSFKPAHYMSVHSTTIIWNYFESEKCYIMVANMEGIECNIYLSDLFCS
jgi:hypothetical protein